MDIVVTPLDPANATAAEQAYHVVAACTAVDLPDFPPPCRKQFFGSLHHPWPGEQALRALAYVSDEPVGYVELVLPILDNVENVVMDLYVHPEHRRRGVGRALHEYSACLLREHGRKRITAMSPFPLPGAPPAPEPGTAFAQAVGATSALVEVRRRLDIDRLDEAELDRLLSAAWERAAGYSLVRWIGPAPEEYVADVAYLEGRLLADAPIGDLEWEPEKMDTDRVRQSEAARAARGRTTVQAGMRHDASGRLVAYTALDIDGSSRWHAFQQITLVDPAHRGHRLGTIVKIGNLRAAREQEPALRAIDTWNAAVNAHMIGINEAMGFRPVDQWHNWQLAL